MKVLTATSTGQGRRSNDFHSATEGELVWIGDVCATDRRNPDGGCGCGRAFSGLSSHRATTTALVRDLPLSREDVMTALVCYFESAGYGVVPRSELDSALDDLLRYAAGLPAETVVERRLDVLQPR